MLFLSSFFSKILSKISNGYRMPIPRGCPPVVARIMKACWHVDPAKRPSFLLITTLLTTKVQMAQAVAPKAPPTSGDLYL